MTPRSGRSHRSSVCTQENKEHGEVNPKVRSSPPDLPVPSLHAPARTARIKPLGWAKWLFCTTSPITSPKRGTAAHRGRCRDINEHQRPPGFPVMVAASRRGESFTGHQLPGQPMIKLFQFYNPWTSYKMDRFQRDEAFPTAVSQPECPVLTLKSFESGPSSGKAGRLCGQDLGSCCLLQRVALEFFLCMCA